jgi:hypothetical protein
MCVRILLCMCPHATMCVLILLASQVLKRLYVCPHTTSGHYICVLILLASQVLKRLYVCPHTTSGHYICVLILLASPGAEAAAAP